MSKQMVDFHHGGVSSAWINRQRAPLFLAPGVALAIGLVGFFIGGAAMVGGLSLQGTRSWVPQPTIP
jgi:hypothetical protein